MSLHRWPWVSVVLAAATALNPIGLDFIQTAFYSSDQLSRNIARPIVLFGAVGFLVGGVIEWSIRWWLARRYGA